MSNKHLVFLYGSLKRGQMNHNIVEKSTFIDCGITEEHYNMYAYDNFPMLIESEEESNIRGEIYEVSDEILESIDFLESNGEFYERKLIKIESFKEPVWCYFTIAYDADLLAECSVVNSDINDVQDWNPS